MVKNIFKFLFWLFVGLMLFSIILTVTYRFVNPPFTPLMLIRYSENKTEIKHAWVDIQNIPQSLIDCAVAAEDNNFLTHRGFDFDAIEKAMDERKTKGRVRGASTISQQTAKNVFLWQGRTWLRKGLEAYFTFLIETFWSKERIMEVYLNVIEMGNGIYGCEAATQHYFGKHARQLTLEQSALVVASFPSPLTRNPAKPSKYLRQRAAKISALSKKIGNVKFDKTSIEKAKERKKLKTKKAKIL